MSINQHSTIRNRRSFEAHLASGMPFDLEGNLGFDWSELQGPGDGLPVNARQVLRYVYEYGAPVSNPLDSDAAPNTMLLLAAGAFGVLALRRSKQNEFPSNDRREGVKNHD